MRPRRTCNPRKGNDDCVPQCVRLHAGRLSRGAGRAVGVPLALEPARTRCDLSLQGWQALPPSGVLAPRRPRGQVESPGPASTASREGGGIGSRGEVQERRELRVCIRKFVLPRQERKVGRACGNESAVASLNCEKAVQGSGWSMDIQKDRAAGKPFHAFAQRCMDAAPSLITQGGSRVQRPCSTPPLTCGVLPLLEGKE